MSKKGGTGGGGWIQPKGANSVAVTGFSFRNTLVGCGWTISLGRPMHKWAKKIVISTCRVPISSSEGFPSLGKQLLPERCDYCKLVNGVMDM